MSDHSSDYHHHHHEEDDVDMYEEVQQHVEEEEEGEGEDYHGTRSATRPPEDEEDEQHEEHEEAEADAEEEDASAPPQTAPEDVYTPPVVAPLQMGAVAANTHSGATYTSHATSPGTGRESNLTTSRRRTNGYNGGVFGEGPVTPRSSSAQVSPRVVRRSNSVFSSIRTGDGRNITKENHESLMPDPTVQELRRQSIISASRYRSARRANSLTNALGVRQDGGASSAGSRTPRRGGGGGGGSRSGSVVSTRHLSPAEAEVLEQMAANDEHRLETYERAKELEVERTCYIIDQELDKHIKAEESYVKMLDTRHKEMEKKRIAREKRMDEAWRRRQEQEEARRRTIEDKIYQREVAEVTTSPYYSMIAKRRYSSPAPMGCGASVSSSNAGVVRRPSAAQRGHAIAPQRNGNGNGATAGYGSSHSGEATPRPRASSASRRRSGSVVAEHPRGWR